MFDAHCHLQTCGFPRNDSAPAIRMAMDAGVTGFCSCGVHPDDWQDNLRLCRGNRSIRCALGIHPMALGNDRDGTPPSAAEGRQWVEEKLTFLADLLDSPTTGPEIVAVGECGLDARFVEKAPMDLQRMALEGHLELAEKHGLPAVVHCVRALDVLEEVLKSHREVRCLLHCFGGSREQARRFLTLGDHFFSLGGTLTLPSKKRHDLVRWLPPERILTESDAPDGPSFFEDTTAGISNAGSPEGGSSAKVGGPAGKPGRPLPAQLVPTQSLPHLVPLAVRALAALRPEIGDKDIWSRLTHDNACAFLGENP